MERIIGKYTQGLPGPLLVCIGGMHGNERAGIRAIDLILKMLEVEPITNPDFIFRGNFIGLVGHVAASIQGVRFLDRDLNRLWTKEKMDSLLEIEFSSLVGDDLELYELEKTIRDEIQITGSKEVVILDLHTTSASGGIYTIVPDDYDTIELAKGLMAPVVLGMLEGLQGTTLHYFKSENFSVPVKSLCFEAGQHNDPLSVNRAIAVIINCLRQLGCIQAKDIESRHLNILRDYAIDLPEVTRLVYRHAILPTDQFKMLSGFGNFDPVSEGQLLAKDIHGDIQAIVTGFILMPLYQLQGEDGFFIVKSIES